jgi:hypothetical protein
MNNHIHVFKHLDVDTEEIICVSCGYREVVEDMDHDHDEDSDNDLQDEFEE